MFSHRSATAADSVQPAEKDISRREMLGLSLGAALASTCFNNSDALAAESQKKEASLVRGAIFPEVKMPDPEGKIRTLAAANENKIVLVEFWGPWCGACLQEIPALKKAYAELKDREFVDPANGNKFAEGFTVFSISANMEDQHSRSWKSMIKSRGLSWPNHVETDDIALLNKTYEVSGFPTNFLLDPQGKIIAKNVDPGSLSLYLGKFIKK